MYLLTENVAFSYFGECKLKFRFNPYYEHSMGRYPAKIKLINLHNSV